MQMNQRLPGLRSSLRTLGTGGGSGGVSMPAGAIGLWYADEYNGAGVRKVIPNKLSGDAPLQYLNRLHYARSDRFGFQTNCVCTFSRTDSRGAPRSVRVVGTGAAWRFGSTQNITFPAGTFTTIVYGKSNTGGNQTCLLGSKFTPTQAVTFTPTFGPVVVTEVKSAAGANELMLFSDGTDVDIEIDCFFVVAGASNPYGSTVPKFGGHIILGDTAYNNVPSVASNQVDISVTAVEGRMVFDTPVTLASFTAFACVKKVATTPGTRTSIMSYDTGGNSPFGELGLMEEETLSPGFMFRGFQNFGQRQPATGTTKLFDLFGAETSVIVWQYNAATSEGSVWIDDVLFARTTTARAAISGFDSLLFNDLSSRTSVKWNSGAFYPSVLSRTEIETAVSFLRTKATANGLTLNSFPRTVIFEGDSNTIGIANPSRNAWPYLYKTATAKGFIGTLFAASGNKLADMVARAAILDAIIPTNKGSRKFALVGMIGTNDGTLTFTSPAATYLANLLAYWAARKAAGYITVAVGILSRTDANAASGFEAWRNTINAGLRAAVGTQLDGFVDVEANSNIGLAASPNNATYFQDTVHLSYGVGGGQEQLEAMVRAVVDPLL